MTVQEQLYSAFHTLFKELVALYDAGELSESRIQDLGKKCKQSLEELPHLPEEQKISAEERDQILISAMMDAGMTSEEAQQGLQDLKDAAKIYPFTRRIEEGWLKGCFVATFK